MPDKRSVLTAQRKEKLEELAQEVLDDYFTGDELIKPEVIAQGEGIKHTLNNYKKDFKGLIVHRNGKFQIFINNTYGATLQDPISRYSFAHELGHYFIDEHRIELMNQGILPHSENDPVLAENIFEKEAEYFASCLLMPRKRFIEDIKGMAFSSWFIHRLCKTYKVSLTAALMRYMVYGEHPIAVIFNFLDGRHDRKLKSKNFWHYNIKIDEKGYIPANSVAGRYCYEGIEDVKTNNLIAADVWFSPKTEEDALRVFREECLIQKNLNRVVSIIYEKQNATL